MYLAYSVTKGFCTTIEYTMLCTTNVHAHIQVTHYYLIVICTVPFRRSYKFSRIVSIRYKDKQNVHHPHPHIHTIEISLFSYFGNNFIYFFFSSLPKHTSQSILSLHLLNHSEMNRRQKMLDIFCILSRICEILKLLVAQK